MPRVRRQRHRLRWERGTSDNCAVAVPPEPHKANGARSEERAETQPVSYLSSAGAERDRTPGRGHPEQDATGARGPEPLEAPRQANGWAPQRRGCGAAGFSPGERLGSSVKRLWARPAHRMRWKGAGVTGKVKRVAVGACFTL